MVKGAESPEGGESLREEIMKEERIQIRTLDALDTIAEECRSNPTCFCCPFRMYDMNQIDSPELLYKALTKNICSLFMIFNGRPEEMNRFRLDSLIKEGRSTDVLEKKAGDTGRG